MPEQPKCPVDDSTKEVWLKQQSTNNKNESAKALPPNHPPASSEGSGVCPVDHSSQDVWLKNHLQTVNGSAGGAAVAAAPAPIISIITEDVECSSDEIPEHPKYTTAVNLPTEREKSSIPRTGTSDNWVYPSEKQFFEAMKRKNWDPEAVDMKAVVPIHNSVNERVWNYIKIWEDGQGGDVCGGIKLTSFKGDSKKLTPRAWFRSSILGMTKPFDRHDWVVDRCGKQIDYVIDFYSNPEPEKNHLPPIYLDVRPKVNTFEGCKLRVMKMLGF
ncbi:cytochrome c1 heme lyase CYT2 [Kluyveromyces lactis]|uniref:Holocytochrome c-type synthase n=1 Tax=Kluyveromyces lactis (strain ATCC 8585 / CBS 2359 / DSM 70799 / NBRC 1267 / NRRL Y-1140 / WM37) TaxID=284590 RepID=Q6CIK6_KLULA|nr:uncharacterized protein KLLA0_F25894g [Kluyveromyces lactis]CAG98941.1 KLLA0F25894p [Kluyveromyces lactis]|eukprot:XP_456233.1 uncharacterized protein KLLA0_F25894g [Kluyveromyces lactis]